MGQVHMLYGEMPLKAWKASAEMNIQLTKEHSWIFSLENLEKTSKDYQGLWRPQGRGKHSHPMVLHFICQVDWAMEYPDIWSSSPRPHSDAWIWIHILKKSSGTSSAHKVWETHQPSENVKPPERNGNIKTNFLVKVSLAKAFLPEDRSWEWRERRTRKELRKPGRAFNYGEQTKETSICQRTYPTNTGKLKVREAGSYKSGRVTVKRCFLFVMCLLAFYFLCFHWNGSLWKNSPTWLWTVSEQQQHFCRIGRDRTGEYFRNFKAKGQTTTTKIKSLKMCFKGKELWIKNY